MKPITAAPTIKDPRPPKKFKFTLTHAAFLSIKLVNIVISPYFSPLPILYHPFLLLFSCFYSKTLALSISHLLFSLLYPLLMFTDPHQVVSKDPICPPPILFH